MRHRDAQVDEAYSLAKDTQKFASLLGKKPKGDEVAREGSMEGVWGVRDAESGGVRGQAGGRHGAAAHVHEGGGGDI